MVELASRRLRGAPLASIAVLGLGLAAVAEQATEGAPLSGREIMQRVAERPESRDMVAHARWSLIDPGGGVRERETRVLRRDATADGAGLRTQWLIVFDAPARIKDTALLVWSPARADTRDDQWLYLPAYRKVRRIAISDRGSPFMGSDFSFEDLTEREVDEDDHRLLRNEVLDGRDHAVVESTALDSAPYAKRVHWVDVERSVVSRTDFFDAEGRPVKRLRIDWQDLGGVWTWKRLEMTTLEGGHRTVVEVARVELDTGVGADVFTQSRLRLGVR